LGEEGVKHLIIFDFDGVVADSEVLANTVQAALLNEHGMSISLEDSMSRFVGKRDSDVRAAVEAELGRSLPETFLGEFESRTLAALQADLQPVPGVVQFIDDFARHAHCIASSSTPAKLALSLKKLGLAEHFGSNVFSATMVARGKPDPDIFLLAASQMKAHPDQCIVIEDSISGVKAGRAAGMTTIGLLAGSHIRPGHGEVLKAAGAHYAVDSYAEAKALFHRLDIT
jgi:HAD superfamily hydrolase (TIGR01509 family)